MMSWPRNPSKLESRCGARCSMHPVKSAANMRYSLWIRCRTFPQPEYITQNWGWSDGDKNQTGPREDQSEDHCRHAGDEDRSNGVCS